MSIVLIAPKDAKDIIILDHPRTFIPTQFLITTGSTLCEVITLSQKAKQSLIYEDYIIGSAPVHVAAPFDPTFLLISSLSRTNQADQFVDPDELLNSFPIRVRSILAPYLSRVCDSLDVVGDGGIPYYRLSRGKVHEYVQARIASVQAQLPPSILDKLPREQSIIDLAKQKAAMELVGSYLTPTLSAEVAALYNFSALAAYLETRKSDYLNPNEFIKRKGEDNESATTQVAKKAKKGSKGVEALKKANTKGMKSMTSFFTKKAKA